MNPILTDKDIPKFNYIEEVHATLHTRGCMRCSLGFQPGLNGCCVSRGRFDTKRMIIGEAPGKEEDAKGAPFTGPAGQLLDQIWSAVGMNTNDWYITNVIHCRPIADKGSGKQNFTPKSEQVERCKVYIDEEIRLLRPRIIVTTGAIATRAILGTKGTFRMGDYRGKLLRHTFEYGWGTEIDTLIFPMLHPAALLHARGNTELYNTYRQQTWDDIRKLKQILEENTI